MTYLRYCRAIVEEYGLENAYTKSQQKWMVDETSKSLAMDIDSVLRKSVSLTGEDLAAKTKSSDAAVVVKSDYVARLFWEGLGIYKPEVFSTVKRLVTVNDIDGYKDAVVDYLNRNMKVCDGIELAVYGDDGCIYISDDSDLDTYLKAILFRGMGTPLHSMLCNHILTDRLKSFSDYMTSSNSAGLVKYTNIILNSFEAGICEVTPYVIPVDKYLDSGHLFCQVDTTFTVMIPLKDYDKPVEHLIVQTNKLDGLFASGRLHDIKYKLNASGEKYTGVFEDGSLVSNYIKNL